MNPLIYIYEEQLLEIIDAAGNEIKRAVAFEWPGEDVFHVHTRFPKVAPSGAPFMAYFKVVQSNVEFQNAETIFKHDLAAIQQADSRDLSSIIGIILFVDNEKLHKVAFLKKEGLIVPCEVKYVPEKSELYSRSKGLLEVGILENKKVLIVGLGSFGSHIAVELAKSGVGNFVLIDYDRIELSNISRHICGVNELGRYKTFAVRDAILVKNPFAKITTIEQDITQSQHDVRNAAADADLIICVTDNNRSRFNINEIAIGLNKTVLFGRAITRAEGGDVFRFRPNHGPCYNCLTAGAIKMADEEISSINQAKKVLPAYMQQTQENIQAAIQVGLSCDILPLWNMLVKLALLELSKGLNNGINLLEEELSYDYYIWANRRDKEYLNWAPFNNAGNRPAILRWFGVKVPKDPECLVCNLS